jgi:hypothetical protein
MINGESTSLIESAISDCETELKALDQLTVDAAAAQEITNALEADVAAIRINAAGLDAKVRGSKFTAANSALSLAQTDLETVQAALSAQKIKTVAIGKSAARMLFDARDALQIQRRSNVAAWLTAQFDWTAIPVVTPSDLAAVHQTVQAIGQLSVSNLPYELEHDDETSVQAFRRLGEHWAELRPLVELEPGLSLNISAVKIPSITKPKPALVGNQLGTLVAA